MARPITPIPLAAPLAALARAPSAPPVAGGLAGLAGEVGNGSAGPGAWLSSLPSTSTAATPVHHASMAAVGAAATTTHRKGARPMALSAQLMGATAGVLHSTVTPGGTTAMAATPVPQPGSHNHHQQQAAALQKACEEVAAINSRFVASAPQPVPVAAGAGAPQHAHAGAGADAAAAAGGVDGAGKGGAGAAVFSPPPSTTTTKAGAGKRKAAASLPPAPHPTSRLQRSSNNGAEGPAAPAAAAGAATGAAQQSAAAGVSTDTFTHRSITPVPTLPAFDITRITSPNIVPSPTDAEYIARLSTMHQANQLGSGSAAAAVAGGGGGVGGHGAQGVPVTATTTTAAAGDTATGLLFMSPPPASSAFPSQARAAGFRSGRGGVVQGGAGPGLGAGEAGPAAAAAGEGAVQGAQAGHPLLVGLPSKARPKAALLSAKRLSGGAPSAIASTPQAAGLTAAAAAGPQTGVTPAPAALPLTPLGEAAAAAGAGAGPATSLKGAAGSGPAAGAGAGAAAGKGPLAPHVEAALREVAVLGGLPAPSKLNSIVLSFLRQQHRQACMASAAVPVRGWAWRAASVSSWLGFYASCRQLWHCCLRLYSTSRQLLSAWLRNSFVHFTSTRLAGRHAAAHPAIPALRAAPGHQGGRRPSQRHAPHGGEAGDCAWPC